jgi:hypothetical protein
MDTDLGTNNDRVRDARWRRLTSGFGRLRPGLGWRLHETPQMLACEVRVDHRRAQIRVPHRFPYVNWVRTLNKPRGDSATPEIVGMERGRELRAAHSVLERCSEGVDARLVVTAFRRVVKDPQQAGEAEACKVVAHRRHQARSHRYPSALA